jgi:hypothetical protein
VRQWAHAQTFRAGCWIAKRSEFHRLALTPKRWVVKCSFGQLNTSLAFVHLAPLALLLRNTPNKPQE